MVVETLPAYVQTGRVFGVVWHRAFVSLWLHPEWPFGNLREVYDCTKAIPEGLAHENIDRNGHCVWVVYAPNRARSSREILDGVYGDEYEKAMRQALFAVFASYPKQVLEVFFYIKSLYLLRTLREAFQLNPATAPKAILAIVGIQFLILISFIAASVRRGMNVVNRQLSIVFVFFFLSLVPPYVAWAIPWTSVDAFFFMYCSIAVVVALPVQVLAKFILAPLPMDRCTHASSPPDPFRPGNPSDE